MEKIQSAPNIVPGSIRMFKCKAALAPAFKNLAVHATLYGWHDAEIALALADLADHHVEATAKELDIRKWQPLPTKHNPSPKMPDPIELSDLTLFAAPAAPPTASAND